MAIELDGLLGITSDGNVTTGNFFVGNGYYLTNVQAVSSYNDANVTALLAGGTVPVVDVVDVQAQSIQTLAITAFGNISTTAFFVGDGSQLTNLPASGSGVIIGDQQIAGDGNVTYSLDQAATTQSVIVTLNGVTQIPTTAYTVAGNTITFASAVSNANVIDIRYFAASGGNSSIYGDANVAVFMPTYSGNLGTANTTPVTAIFTDGYYYANGAPFSGGGTATLPLANGTSNFDIATVNGNPTITSDGNTWTFGGATPEAIYWPDGSFQSTAFVGIATTAEAVSNVGNTTITLDPLGANVVWAFDTDGNLTLPDTAGILSAASISIEANSTPNTSGIYLNGDADSNIYAHNDVVINANTNGTSSTWTFDSIGTLTAPGNVETTGNVVASYLWGDGSNITGLPTYSQVPPVYLVAPANGNNQVFSNVILSSYTANTDMTVFLNGVLIQNTEYTLVGDQLTVNTYLNINDTIDVTTQFAGNITSVTSGYGNSNVTNFLNAGLFTGDFIPAGNATQDLGSSTNQWKDLWLSGNTLYMTQVPISLTSANTLQVDGANVVTSNANGNVDLVGNVNAAGMTITGNAIITGNANVQGTLTYNNTTSITTDNLVIGLGNSQTGINVTGGGMVVGNTAEAQFLYNQPQQTWDSNIGIDATGNITAPYFIGNGSQLTGLPSGYTNTNVTNLLSSGNVTSNVITTANVSATNIISTSTMFGGSDIVLGNTANTSATKARMITFGANTFIQTGNGTTGTTGNVVFATYGTDNARVVIDTTGGNITANGNVSANYFIGNGSQLTGLTAAVPNWTSAGTIQAVGIGATTTAPTVPTGALKNNISYRQLGPKTWQISGTFEVTTGATGGAAGSGDYLFTLPLGLQFDTTLPMQSSYQLNVGGSNAALLARTIPGSVAFQTDFSTYTSTFPSGPIIWDATRYRILISTSSTYQCWGSGGSGWFAMSNGTRTAYWTFTFQST
jgi:hypothetical protein